MAFENSLLLVAGNGVAHIDIDGRKEYYQCLARLIIKVAINYAHTRCQEESRKESIGGLYMHYTGGQGFNNE